ncbi:hypothetical protein BKA61DRAFT_58136 [Leptodontidium sp. MPI-SDFR-AT-0119]|nr:hypothetical protein BKA61DRAFT_58136 [Leptodontidium sp. MPI-SDFR-AT-0119]
MECRRVVGERWEFCGHMAPFSYSEPLNGEVEDIARILRVDLVAATTLVRKCDVLTATLSTLQDSLIEEGKVLKDDTAIRLERQKVLTKGLDEAKVTVSRKQDQVDRLNVTEPMERLETTGTFSSQSDKWRNLHLVPDFYFDLVTYFPIRSVNLINEKKHSKWKYQRYEYGGKRFEIRLKNNPLRSASARVELFGWPKEIHREELVRKSRELLSATQRRDTLRAEVVQGYSDLEQLQSKDKSYADAVDQCLKDLQKVQDLGSLRYVAKERLANYIEADSVHALAILFDLKSAVPATSSMCLDLPKQPAFLFLYGRRQVFLKMKEYTAAAGRMVNEIAQEKTRREQDFHLEAETMLNERLATGMSHIEFMSLGREIFDTPIIGMDDEQKKLVEKSQSAMRKLQNDLELFRERKEKSFQASQKERLAQFDCKPETEAMAKDLAVDWVTNQAVISILSAEKVPIGVISAFKGESKTPDGISSIWRAERLKALEVKIVK